MTKLELGDGFFISYLNQNKQMIFLTINGNREILIPQPSQNLVESLSDQNSEVRLLVTVSPTSIENKFSQSDQPPTEVHKVRIVSIEEYNG